MKSKYRYAVLLMLFLSSGINYLDRSALSVAAPLIKENLGLSTSQMGMIFSSFFIGYIIFNFVGGYSSDVFGPRKVMGVAMTVWSIFAGLTAGAFNFASLFIVRVIFGFGEGPIAAVQSKTISNWFPTKERAGALGIAFSGMPIGAALSAPVVGFLAIHFGWKVSFIIIAIVGFIWTLVWMRMLTDYPRDNPRVSKGELEEIVQGQVTLSIIDADKGSLAYCIRQKPILFTALAFWAFSYTLYFFLTWFPSYLTSERHLSMSAMSIAAAIPWLVGTFGQVSGGFLSNYLYQKTGNLLLSRKLPIVACLLGTGACVALTGFVSTTEGAIALTTVAVFLNYIPSSCYWSIIQDMVPPGKVGGVGGFVHLLANTAGIIAPTITGFAVQSTGYFTSAFVLAGAISVMGALSVAIFVRQLGPALETPALKM